MEHKLSGSRLYYGSYLSGFATPQSVREQFARTQNWNTAQIDEYLLTRQQRLNNWKDELRHYPHRDIYDIESLARELKERTFRGVRISPEQIEERIRLACAYLDEFDNFEIGLSKNKLNFHFHSKSAQIVLMESRREYPADLYTHLFGVELSGEKYVASFKQLFDELWQTALTDKTEVKIWLRGQLS